MRDVAVRVEALGKKYHIGALRDPRYQTLRDQLADALAAPFRRAWKLMRGQATGAAELDETLWALRGVEFEVARGEVLGVIGPNGAGKSTLLKILSRITEPTEGWAEIRGRVGSLLEVGTGFHQELTGRENVYLNGAILGMRRAEIDAKFDQIVAFAEVEKFIDTPVKHYSSGMYLRLAFAVAAHLEPEILVVDEVLAVGDASFQSKCLGKMGQVAGEGRTILFVSHNMAAVARLCDRALWLDHGRIRMEGHPQRVIDAYLRTDAEESGYRRWEEGVANPGVEDVRVYSVAVKDSTGRPASTVASSAPVVLEVEYGLESGLRGARMGFILMKGDGTILFETYDLDGIEGLGQRSPGRFRARCRVPPNLLAPGRYLVTINAGIPRVRNLVHLEGTVSFEVSEAGAVGPTGDGGRVGVVRPKIDWEMERA